MATLYYKLYKGLAKDDKGNVMPVPVGLISKGKTVAPDSASSTGVAITSIDARARIVELKADGNVQYEVSSPLRTADGTSPLLFAGETQYEAIENAKNETWGLTVVEKQ